MSSGGTISNQAAALWQMTGTNDIEDGFQGGPINNAGTWRKSGGSGTSTIAAPFNNSGTLAVDSGTLFFAGSELLNLTSPSKLSFKLSGLTPATDYGKVTTTHNLTAGGTLAVTLGPGFAPALGNSFDLFDWGSIDSFNGSFSALGLPALASGLRWDTSQLYSDGVLTVGVGLPGDFNQNGVVDAPDYVVWLKLLGTTYTPSDYGVWRSHFGQSAGNGSGGGTTSHASVVPEPANKTLVLLGVLVVAQFYQVRTKNSRGSNPQSIG
jgi:hypothetical protein